MYAHIISRDASPTAETNSKILEKAISELIASITESPTPKVLWRLQYQQRLPPTLIPSPNSIQANGRVIQVPEIPPSLALEDDVLRHVRSAWERIVPEDERGKGFMVFEDREDVGARDEDGL